MPDSNDDTSHYSNRECVGRVFAGKRALVNVHELHFLSAPTWFFDLLGGFDLKQHDNTPSLCGIKAEP